MRRRVCVVMLVSFILSGMNDPSTLQDWFGGFALAGSGELLLPG
jgi:hypothetical protein